MKSSCFVDLSKSSSPIKASVESLSWDKVAKAVSTQLGSASVLCNLFSSKKCSAPALSPHLGQSCAKPRPVIKTASTVTYKHLSFTLSSLGLRTAPAEIYRYWRAIGTVDARPRGPTCGIVSLRLV